MEANYLRFIASANPILLNPSTTSDAKLLHICFLQHHHRQPLFRISCTNGNSSTNNGDAPTPPPPVRTPITPPEMVEIRFKRRSRRQKQLSEEGLSDRRPVKAQTPEPAPKKWEDMTVAEKATELYMGEKGLLFWLNKFAYASIFIIIGGWILFRFVGPALNLYQLDSPPLPPSSMFKGS